MTEGETIWIQSVTNPQAEPVCKLIWGAFETVAPLADVRAAALDILTCAAYAEMMMTLVDKVGMPAATVEGFTSTLLAGEKRTMYGTVSTLEFTPAGSTAKGQAFVLARTPPEIVGPSMKTMLSPQEARGMAATWFRVAEGTEYDRIINRALDAMPDADIDRHVLFALMREMRQS